MLQGRHEFRFEGFVVDEDLCVGVSCNYVVTYSLEAEVARHLVLEQLDGGVGEVDVC